MTMEQEMKIVRNFEQLRQKVHEDGLMDQRPGFFAYKLVEVLGLLSLAFTLQYLGWYITSACVLALTWQQLGWLCHEFCHHQPFKNRRINDFVSLFLGNISQGFSRDWWKDKHNSHHAATNIIDNDPDIDLAPLVAISNDLLKYKEPLERLALSIIPYQHLYFTLMLPLLRFSWTSQSIVHVFSASSSLYLKDRKHATAERIGIAIHWTWLGGGLLIAVVVTFNHNSVDKFPENSRLLNNFAALHILTTRNMTSSPLIDWFWGGLNYQIEHHLFPTMPRPNLNECSKYVKQFCEDNKLPYLVDDYITGYKASLRLLRNVAKMAAKSNKKD
uniref:Fatty acid desaturase domain-containing protein n=1 Tax=Ditylenchus dipsaci TaxID=166011 RepID=A0A915E682_9BILA